jgi:hypothetical protein
VLDLSTALKFREQKSLPRLGDNNLEHYNTQMVFKRVTLSQPEQLNFVIPALVVV